MLENGFIRVTEDGGAKFYVQGMQEHVRRSLSGSLTTNSSRPACTCEYGFDPVWCPHREAAYNYVRDREERSW